MGALRAVKTVHRAAALVVLVAALYLISLGWYRYFRFFVSESLQWLGPFCFSFFITIGMTCEIRFRRFKKEKTDFETNGIIETMSESEFKRKIYGE